VRGGEGEEKGNADGKKIFLWVELARGSQPTKKGGERVISGKKGSSKGGENYIKGGSSSRESLWKGRASSGKNEEASMQKSPVCS